MRTSLGNLKKALVAYAILAIAAGFVIKGDIRIRIVLWALFAGLAIKSIAAYMLHGNPPPPPGDSSEQ